MKPPFLKSVIPAALLALNLADAAPLRAEKANAPAAVESTRKDTSKTLSKPQDISSHFVFDRFDESFSADKEFSISLISKRLATLGYSPDTHVVLNFHLDSVETNGAEFTLCNLLMLLDGKLVAVQSRSFDAALKALVEKIPEPSQPGSIDALLKASAAWHFKTNVPDSSLTEFKKQALARFLEDQGHDEKTDVSIKEEKVELQKDFFLYRLVVRAGDQTYMAGSSRDISAYSSLHAEE